MVSKYCTLFELDTFLWVNDFIMTIINILTVEILVKWCSFIVYSCLAICRVCCFESNHEWRTAEVCLRPTLRKFQPWTCLFAAICKPNCLLADRRRPSRRSLSCCSRKRCPGCVSYEGKHRNCHTPRSRTDRTSGIKMHKIRTWKHA